VPRVTALRPDRRDRVGVELDGKPWRVLPIDVVARAGIVDGRELDRPALRLLRRELRRHEALALAARALRHRDLSRSSLDARLDGAGATRAAREETLAVLDRAGLVDDARLAERRASALAERGYGDAAIRHDLAQRAVAAEDVTAAIALLEPESERARRVVARRGATPKTGAYLARRGFGEEAIEGLVAGPTGDEVG
jgi:regulatory protein